MLSYTRQDERVGEDTAAMSVVDRRFDTPWGEGLASVSNGRLVGVELPPLAGQTGDVDSEGLGAEDRRALERWTSELEAYFRGERMSWSVEDLDLEGATQFARRTVEALMSVPAGITVAYGELAEMAGVPRAARAVGSVMAGNPIPVVVPCHRVIRSDGRLGRYGSDPTWKERLLTHERLYSQRG